MGEGDRGQVMKAIEPLKGTRPIDVNRPLILGTCLCFGP
jgi:hypothetical protein